MTSTSTLPVMAAGAVCWRLVDGKARILVVHRAQQQDISLPKGKVEPGETLPQTAVREIAEETGLSVSLGAPLGQVSYDLPSGRPKLVFYWSAEVSEHALESAHFESNSEIEAIEWMPLAKARRKLSYAHDVDIVETFAARLMAGSARTFAIIALRHGKAVPPDSWDGVDATRPLLQRGSDQAASIALGLAAYRPTKILSSTAVRCVATVQPTSRVTGVRVKETDNLSQDAYELGEAEVSKIVAKRIRRGETALLCSHGPVLPGIVEEIARLTNTPIGAALRSAAMLSPGEYSVFHVSVDDPASGIVAIETHSPSA